MGNGDENGEWHKEILFGIWLQIFMLDAPYCAGATDAEAISIPTRGMAN